MGRVVGGHPCLHVAMVVVLVLVIRCHVLMHMYRVSWYRCGRHWWCVEGNGHEDDACGASDRRTMAVLLLLLLLGVGVGVLWMDERRAGQCGEHRLVLWVVAGRGWGWGVWRQW